MLNNVDVQQLIKDKTKSHESINVAILGAGWYGRGVILEMKHHPGMEPRIIFDRDIDKATGALLKYGVDQDKIDIVSTSLQLKQCVKQKRYAISSNTQLIDELPSVIDIFFDATGEMLIAAKAAVSVLNQKIHFLTVGAEMDATVGLALNKIAIEKNVIYSNCDGDQPGCLARLISEVESMGFTIAVAGNGKGFLNYYATPENIMQFVPEGHNPRKIASFTDGSKQSLEMTVLANGTGLVPDLRGMHGVKTTKEDLIKDVTAQISREGVVEYVMGRDCNLGMTVFVIGKREDADGQRDLNYLKMGDGPYYLFFRDFHLCHFETPRSILEIVLFNKPTISPKSQVADVLTIAKKDLTAGEQLDGIGGYSVYGLLDKASVGREENAVPLGISEYAILKEDVKKDTLITYDMVDFPKENLVLKLRKQVDQTIQAHSPVFV